MIHFTKLYLKTHKRAFCFSTIMLLLIFFMILQLVSAYSMKAEYKALQRYEQCIQFIPDYDAFVTEEYDNIEEQQKAEKQIYHDFMEQLKNNPVIRNIYYAYRGVTGVQEAEGDSLFLCNSKNSPSIKTDELKSGNVFSDNEKEVILVSGKTKLYDTVNVEGNDDIEPFKVIGVLKNTVLAIDTGELVDFSTYQRNVYLLNPVFYDKQENYEAGITALYLNLIDNATIDDVRELEYWGELQEIQLQENTIPWNKVLAFMMLVIVELVLSYMFSRYKRDYMWKVIYMKPVPVQIPFILLKNILPVFIGFLFVFLYQLSYGSRSFNYKMFFAVVLLYVIIRLAVEIIIFLRTKNSYLMKLKNLDLLHYNCAYKTMVVRDWLEYIVWEYVDTPKQSVNKMLFDLQMEKYADIPLWKVEQVVLLKFECYQLRAWRNIVCDDESLLRYKIDSEDCIKIRNFMDRTV